MRLAVLSGVVLWVGATLVLAELRRVSRPSLVQRLEPYSSPGMTTGSRSGLLSVASFRDVVGPASRAVGERISRIIGVSEDLALRLERIHSPLEVTGFRVRQAAWALGGLGAGSLLALAFRPAALVAFLLVLGAPLLAFLVAEQRVAEASKAWQRALFLELPVVAEQLAMLLSAGYSLGAALDRVARRASGACAADLGRVVNRVRHGLTEDRALREWAEVARVPGVERLVAVLALDRESGDLGRLLSEEAKGLRRDVHRELLEAVDRRAEQVWIPVTVATLVPGVIFMSIPFIQALRLFAG